MGYKFRGEITDSRSVENGSSDNVDLERRGPFVNMQYEEFDARYSLERASSKWWSTCQVDNALDRFNNTLINFECY